VATYFSMNHMYQVITDTDTEFQISHTYAHKHTPLIIISHGCEHYTSTDKDYKGKLWLLKGNITERSVRILQDDFTGNFLPLQTFQITVYLLTTTLFKGFYNICRL